MEKFFTDRQLDIVREQLAQFIKRHPEFEGKEEHLIEIFQETYNEEAVAQYLKDMYP